MDAYHCVRFLPQPHHTYYWAVFVFAWLLAVPLPAFAQKGVKGVSHPQQVDLTGQLVQKSWSKTSQSYCAGGSDYFVLETETDGEVVLQGDYSLFGEYAGLVVILTGFWQTKTIQPPSPNLQQPAANPMTGKYEPYSCTVFQVVGLEILEDFGNDVETDVETTEFHGAIVLRQQTKSTQSMCANVDEYYVLVEENGTEYLLDGRSFDELSDYENNRVTIKGAYFDYEKQLDGNPYTQKPVGPSGKVASSIRCPYIMITDIVAY